MVILFQLLFILFALFAILGVVKRKQEGLLSIRGMLFWVLFWAMTSVIVLYPETTSMLASRFGIGRGVDLVVYVSIAVIFYVLFRLHVKVEKINRDVTAVVRKNTLDASKK
ncbi:MAG TPA: DUF2304 family protein [Candidatus Kapabacteria bacterium]|nr:DUF2304 family protein [Candidatus Kapabacteria bacterium]